MAETGEPAAATPEAGSRCDFARPATPTDIAYIESFNGSLRDECLNLHWFETLADSQRLIEDWRRDYNVSRPDMALGDIPPAEFTLQTRDSHARKEKSAIGF